MTPASTIGRPGLNARPAEAIPKPLRLLALAAFLSAMLCAAARGAGASDAVARSETCQEKIAEAKRAVRAAAWSTTVSAEAARALEAARDRMAAARSAHKGWPGLAAAEQEAKTARQSVKNQERAVDDAKRLWKDAGSPAAGNEREGWNKAQERLRSAQAFESAKIAAIQLLLNDWSASAAGREYVEAQRELTAAEEAARGLDGEPDGADDALIEEVRVRAALAPVESAIDGLAEAIGCRPPPPEAPTPGRWR